MHVRPSSTRRTILIAAASAVSIGAGIAALLSAPAATTAAAPKAPEPGSAEKKAKKADPAFAPVTDKPGLPRVLLIGDSISIGYTPGVRKLLDGKANVHRIPENGGPTSNGAAKIDKWLGDGNWDVIHFNFGLHDLKIMEGGSHQVGLDDYRKNLTAMVLRMKKTGAVLLFANTTPVPEGKLSPTRKPGDALEFNKAAAEVMAEHGVRVVDLYGAVAGKLSDYQIPANVHFKPAGSEALAAKVAEAITSALESRAKPK